MAPATSTDCNTSRSSQRYGIPVSRPRVGLLLTFLFLGWAPWSCKAGGSSFGFSIHHRFSDPVRSIFPSSDNELLPEKDSVDYFASMAERDRIHGRRLTTVYETPLTFVAGNTTYKYPHFGFLYYANVSIGTPGLDFLVALDTGSDNFWVPCDCVSCVTSIQTNLGVIKYNTYELNASSTSKRVPCSSPLCDHRVSCQVPYQCPYQVVYMSANTTSSGYLVEDVMHLTTDSYPSKPVEATIIFGCGQRQTGKLLKGGAPNGLIGLGLDQISVPSTLARQNVTANSFSLCFARGGIGRISFGDKGSSDQAETPFVFQLHRSYFVGITQIVVGNNSSNVETNVLFDTGTSFTYFTDPAYTIIAKSFNSQVKGKRFTDSRLPFEFCYEMSSCSGDIYIPSINLTMTGGAKYNVISPLLLVMAGDESCVYCLAIMKEETISIIGENFMTGYRIVFDREKLVMGWKESDCDYAFETKTKLLPTTNGKFSENSSAASNFKHWALPLFLLLLRLSAIL